MFKISMKLVSYTCTCKKNVYTQITYLSLSVKELVVIKSII